MKPLLSVVVPVYNVEKYLHQCIKSILNQTFDNFEVILVDDGSKDASGQFCDDFAALDNRISVIHKKNGGLVSARKAGLKKAIGKYVTYVDSDDWIDSEMFNIMMSAIQARQLDMVCCQYSLECENKTIPYTMNWKSGIYRQEEIEQLKQNILCYKNKCDFGIAPSVWGKIFEKKKLLSCQMQVPEVIKMGEDVAVTVPYILCCDSIQILNESFYHYRINNTSITHTLKPNLLYENLLLMDYLQRVIAPQWNTQLQSYAWMLLTMILSEETKMCTAKGLKEKVQAISQLPRFQQALEVVTEKYDKGQTKLLFLLHEKDWKHACALLRRQYTVSRIKGLIKWLLRNCKF